MPLDYSKPSVIKFLKENFEREKDQRAGWFLANKDTLIRQATFDEKNKDYRVEHIRRAPIEICMPIVSADHIVSAVNRRKKVPIDGPIIGFTKDRTGSIAAAVDKNDSYQEMSGSKAIMRPVESDIANLLYSESPVGGRNQYLNARKLKIPDEKYFFCETSTNAISWQWKDSAFPRRPPTYGKQDTILREFSRSGPQPDPKHYKQLDQDNKCLT